jgi:hypothetical protein
MSQGDMVVVQQAGDQIKDLWLVTFTQSQKLMIAATFNAETNAFFDSFFSG